MEFVNRDAELRELDAAAKRGGLLVVFGRRRVGKTRLLRHWLQPARWPVQPSHRSPARLADSAGVRRPPPAARNAAHPQNLAGVARNPGAAEAALGAVPGRISLPDGGGRVAAEPVAEVAGPFAAARLPADCGGFEHADDERPVSPPGGAALRPRPQAPARPADGLCGVLRRLRPSGPATRTRSRSSPVSAASRSIGSSSKPARMSWHSRNRSTSITRPTWNRSRNGILRDEGVAGLNAVAVLEAVGRGAERPSEIASRLGTAQTNLSRLLQQLLDASILVRELPFGESVRSTKKILYRIQDPTMRFWFRVYSPHQSLWRTYTAAQKRKLIHDHAATVFEDFCRARFPGAPAVLGARHRTGPGRARPERSPSDCSWPRSNGGACPPRNGRTCFASWRASGRTALCAHAIPASDSRCLTLAFSLFILHRFDEAVSRPFCSLWQLRKASFRVDHPVPAQTRQNKLEQKQTENTEFSKKSHLCCLRYLLLNLFSPLLPVQTH